jgi:hypothetical protein
MIDLIILLKYIVICLFYCRRTVGDIKREILR